MVTALRVQRLSKRRLIAAAMATAVGALLFATVGRGSATTPLATDQVVSADVPASAASLTSPTFSTSSANELLVAFVTVDGPSDGSSQSITSLTGGGLAWSVAGRSNAQAGTAEVWEASATAVVSNATVIAVPAVSGFSGSITVATFTGAAGIGARNAAAASGGAPSVSLSSTTGGSWVWGVGNDWDNGIARTPAAGQILVHQVVDIAVGNTFWVQRASTTSASAGQTVGIADTSPTTDRWDLVAVEIVPAAVAPPRSTTTTTTTTTSVPPIATPMSLWSSSTTPAVPSANDGRAIELGTRFGATVSGFVTGVRFYKGAGNTGAHVGNLWSDSGALLATGTFTSETASGWQQLTLAKPVAITAGTLYVVSYHTMTGHYSYTPNAFKSSVTTPPLYAPADGTGGQSNGVFNYGTGSAFPAGTYHSLNYWVDVVFVPGSGGGGGSSGGSGSTTTTQAPGTTSTTRAPTTTQPSTTTTQPSTTTTQPSTTTTQPSSNPPVSGPVSGVTLEPIDGGSNFYSGHGYTAAAALDNPSFFPIGAWYLGLTSATDVSTYEDLSLNMLDRPTADCNLSLLAGTGIYAIPQYGECGGVTGGSIGKESVGLFTDDEVDMNYGPGAGYTYLQNLIDAVPASIKNGRFFWSNYGKGVMIWETDSQAAIFVNSYQQTVSDDFYWFTDGDINGPWGAAPWDQAAQFYNLSTDATTDQAKRGSNYGSAVDRLRALESPAGSQPIWGFVEDGCPGSNGQCVTPSEMNWAVWSSIIHGARGIIYFNHSFSGPSQGDNNFEDPYYTSTGIYGQAKTTNALIKSLAPVLNDMSAVGYVSVNTPPQTFAGIETMVKYHAGHFYIFTDTRDSETAKNILASFTVPNTGATEVSVVGENRTIPLVGGTTFTDTFATGSSVHIYEI